MATFVPSTPLRTSSLTPASLRATTPLPAHARVAPSIAPRMTVTPYSAAVDEFFAKDVRAQYIAKACPTGVPPIQCIEGVTFDEPYESRTLKRQSQLRYRQLPVSVRIHNMYETRKAALISCHGCEHEENRVLKNPMLAASMTFGQAEASRACNRYIESSGPAEDMMCRSVENVYMKAVNGSGVFTTACTDGQAKYEAYLMQQRCKSTAFRAKQYSPAAKAGAAFAARKMAIARNHICLYEDGLYSKFPRMAGTMRPSFGYYGMLHVYPQIGERYIQQLTGFYNVFSSAPFVTSPSRGGYRSALDFSLDPTQIAALTQIGSIGRFAAKSALYAK